MTTIRDCGGGAGCNAYVLTSEPGSMGSSISYKVDRNLSINAFSVLFPAPLRFDLLVALHWCQSTTSLYVEPGQYWDGWPRLRAVALGDFTFWTKERSDYLNGKLPDKISSSTGIGSKKKFLSKKWSRPLCTEINSAWPSLRAHRLIRVAAMSGSGGWISVMATCDFLRFAKVFCIPLHSPLLFTANDCVPAVLGHTIS